MNVSLMFIYSAVIFNLKLEYCVQYQARNTCKLKTRDAKALTIFALVAIANDKKLQ